TVSAVWEEQRALAGRLAEHELFTQCVERGVCDRVTGLLGQRRRHHVDSVRTIARYGLQLLREMRRRHPDGFVVAVQSRLALVVVCEVRQAKYLVRRRVEPADDSVHDENEVDPGQERVEV